MRDDERPVVIVAGHICLDMIPQFTRTSGVGDQLVPGRLVEVGASVLATGGAVFNTGLALQKLGVQTRLMGKVGDDLFGRAMLDLLRDRDPALADQMIVAEGENSSYSIVISQPGVDRIFLHCPGANDSFCANDVNVDGLRNARLFHFGYPPLMRRMYANDGAELEIILRRVKACGITTSLDMAKPDPQSEAGRADWRRILKRILPFVDVFLPSLEEILFMMDRDRVVEQGIDGSTLSDVANQLLEWGAAIVGIKLGDQGLYLRTTTELSRLSGMGVGVTADSDSWVDRELLAPCFCVDVMGTTGAGDCTVAGFLTGLLHGQNPEDALTGAVAVGACNVEAADATSGVQSWESVWQRIDAGWTRRAVDIDLNGWAWNERRSVWMSPHDSVHAQGGGAYADE